jgi:hypothetical protein
MMMIYNIHEGKVSSKDNECLNDGNTLHLNGKVESSVTIDIGEVRFGLPREQCYHTLQSVSQHLEYTIILTHNSLLKILILM